MKGKQDKNQTLLSMEGDLTIARAVEFRDLLLDSLQKSDSIEIDLATAESVDLSFLQLLCSAHRTAVRDGKELAITGKPGSAFLRARQQAGFSGNKNCRDCPDIDCLWSGGLEG
jgi:anti-anti-sigma regulatory factor